VITFVATRPNRRRWKGLVVGIMDQWSGEQVALIVPAYSDDSPTQQRRVLPEQQLSLIHRADLDRAARWISTSLHHQRRGVKPRGPPAPHPVSERLPPERYRTGRGPNGSASTPLSAAGDEWGHTASSTSTSNRYQSPGRHATHLERVGRSGTRHCAPECCAGSGWPDRR